MSVFKKPPDPIACKSRSMCKSCKGVGLSSRGKTCRRCKGSGNLRCRGTLIPHDKPTHIMVRTEHWQGDCDTCGTTKTIDVRCDVSYRYKKDPSTGKFIRKDGK